MDLRPDDRANDAHLHLPLFVFGPLSELGIFVLRVHCLLIFLAYTLWASLQILELEVSERNRKRNGCDVTGSQVTLRLVKINGEWRMENVKVAIMSQIQRWYYLLLY